jgi:hypothetical protein
MSGKLKPQSVVALKSSVRARRMGGGGSAVIIKYSVDF